MSRVPNGPPFDVRRGRRWVLMTDMAGCAAALSRLGAGATEELIADMQIAIAWATWKGDAGIWCGQKGGDDTVAVFRTRRDLHIAVARATRALAKRGIFIKGAAARDEVHVQIGMRLMLNKALVSTGNAAEMKGRRELKHGQLRVIT